MKSKCLTLLSLCYVVFALWLLCGTVERCVPQVGQWVRTAMTGWGENPIRTAFLTLAEGLEAGLPVGETVAASVEVLIGG